MNISHFMCIILCFLFWTFIFSAFFPKCDFLSFSVAFSCDLLTPICRVFPQLSSNEPHREKNRIFAYAKTKAQISFAVTAKLISASVFATRIVYFLFYLNPKFQASSSFLRLYRPVCVGPGRKPRRPVFSRRGSNKVLAFPYQWKVSAYDAILEETVRPADQDLNPGSLA